MKSMEAFLRCVTYLRNWLLAVLGSPTMHTLMSPLSEVPSMVVLGTPPNSISRMPRFTSSFPAQSNSPFSQEETPSSKQSSPGRRKRSKAARALTVDGGEEAGAQVVVQVLVLAHLEHFLPLLLRHLALDALGGLLLLPQLLTAKLQPQDTHF